MDQILSNECHFNSRQTTTLKTDSNCIQVLAPSDSGGLNVGTYCRREHIGHISREFSALLAPILDEFSSVSSVTFKLLPMYSDTNHSRAVNDIDLEVGSSDVSQSSHVMFNFSVANLNPIVLRIYFIISCKIRF